MGAPPRPSAERARQKVLLIYGGQHLSGASLERPVRYVKARPRGVSPCFPGFGIYTRRIFGA